MRVKEIDILAHNWHGIYFHGKLNIDDDRVSSDVPIPEDGVYPIIYDKGYPKRLLLFKWSHPLHPFSRGLIVDPNDIEALEYAAKCFNRKALTL